MPQFSTRHHVGHTAEQMFELVADIAHYPAFLPLCEDLEVRERTMVDGKPVIVADMTVGYKALRETFTSRVTLDRPNRTIRVAYIDGPFRYLDNVWSFAPAEAGSYVDFAISYAFKSRLLEMLVGSLFDKAFRKFTQAFETRALEIYGQPDGQEPEHAWLTDALRRSGPPVAT
jgi:coenzyme Q-binding protein COQ10